MTDSRTKENYKPGRSHSNKKKHSSPPCQIMRYAKDTWTSLKKPTKYSLSKFHLYNIATMLYSRSWNLIHIMAESLYSFTSPSLFPSYSSPWQQILYSVSLNLTSFLDSTYKWYHAVFLLLCLVYST